MNTLIATVFPTTIVSFSIPPCTWFGRQDKPIFKEVSEVERKWSSLDKEINFYSGKTMQFQSLQGLYDYAMDTKKFKYFNYFHNKYGVYASMK